jgi:hypothetical protein
VWSRACTLSQDRTRLLLLSHNFINVMINSTSLNEVHYYTYQTGVSWPKSFFGLVDPLPLVSLLPCLVDVQPLYLFIAIQPIPHPPLHCGLHHTHLSWGAWKSFSFLAIQPMVHVVRWYISLLGVVVHTIPEIRLPPCHTRYLGIPTYKIHFVPFLWPLPCLKVHLVGDLDRYCLFEPIMPLRKDNRGRAL